MSVRIAALGCFFAAAGVFLASDAGAAGTEIGLVNPSFEEPALIADGGVDRAVGYGGPIPGWTRDSGQPIHFLGPTNTHHGRQILYGLCCNGGLRQRVPGAGQPGMRYRLSVWRALSNQNGGLRLTLRGLAGEAGGVGFESSKEWPAGGHGRAGDRVWEECVLEVVTPTAATPGQPLEVSIQALAHKTPHTTVDDVRLGVEPVAPGTPATARIQWPLVNAGFEEPPGGSLAAVAAIPGWQAEPGVVLRLPSTCREGKQALYGVTGEAGVTQTLPAAAAASTRYRLTAWAYRTAGDGGLELGLLHAGGAFAQTRTWPPTAGDRLPTWEACVLEWTSPAGAATGDLTIRLRGAAGPTLVDQVSLLSAPPP